MRLRHYVCGNKKCDSFSQPFTDRAMIDKALAHGGKGKVFCPDCGKPILLRDLMEAKVDSPEVKEKSRKLQDEVQAVIDNQSLELILMGHAFAVADEAGQTYRRYTRSHRGIDGEIELKDDQGHDSGKRLYLQLGPGDSYRMQQRQRDRTEVFPIKNPHWAADWQQRAYPVMLVIRASDNQIRWMDVSAYIKRESDNRKKPVTQIVFNGERFDMMSVRRWRAAILRQGL